LATLTERPHTGVRNDAHSWSATTAARSGGAPLAVSVGLVALVRLPGGPEHAQQSLGNLLIEHLIAKLAQSLIKLRVTLGCRPLVVL
jgi:hypothetical protein